MKTPPKQAVGGPTCCDCVHFEDDPTEIEADLPNIAILGSAFASTRGNAGICRSLGRFHDPLTTAECPCFSRRDER